MNNAKKLNILWTNADPVMAEKMVFMYGINSVLNHWWEEVVIIIWGSTATLAAEDPLIQEKIRQALHVGVKVSACKACAEQLGVKDKLETLGIEVRYWGEPLTELLKQDEKLLTI